MEEFMKKTVFWGFVFPPSGSAVGSSPWNNPTKINNPTVVIDFYSTEFGTFDPNGTYNVRLWIYTSTDTSTNNGSNPLTSPIKTNVNFIDGFTTISF
jgi:hypothetical protein